MIYTFYSFKGGVGRSMALANVAEFFYSRGSRVLVIDWDLEAPGLESFFFGPDDPRIAEVRCRVGLIDYLDQYRREYDGLRPDAKFLEAVGELRPLEKILYQVHPPDPNVTGGGELWLFPAGWRTSRKAGASEPAFDDRFPKYAATVQDFSWSDFYSSYEGEAFFDWFRNRLLNGPPLSGTSSENPSRGFDVVLIDSRTGVTEVGGVCTRQLADVVVSFCAPNYQNLTGAERMSESFATKQIMEARSQRSLEVVVIPARVDEAGETDAQNRFRSQFMQRIRTPAALKESISSSWQLLIPYVTKYAYEESLAVGRSQGNEKLERAYQNLASHLALLSAPSSRLRACLASEIRALQRARPRVHIVGGGVKRLVDAMPGIEFTPDISEATYVLVHFSTSSLAAEVKTKIRDARQRGACVYGLRKAANLDPVPRQLRSSRIFDLSNSLEELKYILGTPCQSRCAPFMCPSVKPGWVSRDEQLKLLKALFLTPEARSAPAVVAIRAALGFGKTALAAALCNDEQILDEFIDGIFWVTPGETGDVLGCLNAMSIALTGESVKFESISEATTRLTQQLVGVTALLVVDNVVRESDFLPFRSLPVSILATVPQSVSLRDVIEFPLDRMSHAESVAAIASVVPNGAPGPHVSRLAYRLAHLPFALSLARTAISQYMLKGLDLNSAAAQLAIAVEKGDFSTFGDSGRSLVREALRQVSRSVRTLPEVVRQAFYSLKTFVDTPTFPMDSFPDRWTSGEEKFYTTVQDLEHEGLLALNTESQTVELSAFAIQYLRGLKASDSPEQTVLVVRPFGRTGNIDFDTVESELIMPALDELGLAGRTSMSVIEDGSIRAEPLRWLVEANLVIGDISLDDWSVFYQLGVRHALRNKHTFLIRSSDGNGTSAPFDIKTDRIVTYSARNPALSLRSLVSELRSVLGSDVPDSPVFSSLPGLVAVSAEQAVAVPVAFKADVDSAESKHAASHLRLYSEEVLELPWALEGLRTVGRAQARLKRFAGAAQTWEAVLSLHPSDKEASLLLGAAYQGLGDLTRSEEALERVSNQSELTECESAKLWSLHARNLEARWRQEWEGKGGSVALQSPLLAESIHCYSEAAQRNPQSYADALNALSLLVIRIELAKAWPEIWSSQFYTDEEAAAERTRMERERSLFVSVVEMALRNVDRADPWAKLATAELTLYTAARPGRVLGTYRQVLSSLPAYVVESARAHLQSLMSLGILKDSIAAVLEVPSYAPAPSSADTTQPATALLFAGHTIDSSTRNQRRFPAEAEPNMRSLIRASLEKIKTETQPGELLALAGGSAGADILFHEVCLELGIKSMLCLPYPASDYVISSVQYAGSDWVGRFYRLAETLAESTLVLGSTEPPSWLGSERHSIWQRNLKWMFANAIETGRPRLLALWDGVVRTGYGGVSDFVHQAQARAISTTIITPEY